MLIGILYRFYAVAYRSEYIQIIMFYISSFFNLHFEPGGNSDKFDPLLIRLLQTHAEYAP